MATQKLNLGRVTGKDAKISEVTVKVDGTHLDQPTASATVSGEAGDQTVAFDFTGLMGKTGNFSSVTVTSDSTHSDSPTAEVTLGGEPGSQTMKIAFKGLMGPQGPSGKDGQNGTNATTTEVASASANGLMSSGDKKKLDAITGGAATSVVLANGTVQAITSLGKVASATVADKLGSSDLGNATTPIYLKGGVPTACSSFSEAIDMTQYVKKTDLPTLLQTNVETIRTALGLVTTSRNGLVPKLPTDPEA